MLLVSFLLFVAVAAIVALRSWRVGLLLCVLAGVVQDPIRKVTPGTPPYLILAVFPIYFAIAFSLWHTRPATRIFVQHHPRTLLPFQLFVIVLVLSSLQTLTYGLQTAPLIILGWSFYLGWMPAVLLGFYF